MNVSNMLRLVDLFKQMNVFPTNGEMRRMLYQGAVKLNEKLYKLDTERLNNIGEIRIVDGIHTLRVGRNKFWYFEVMDGKLSRWSYSDFSKEEED